MLLPPLVPKILVPRILIVAGLVLCSSVLRASTIFTTFGLNNTYSVGTGLVVTDSNFSYSVAVQFTPSADYKLSGIDFVATRQSPDSPDSVTLSIFSDGGGLPSGNPLEALTLAGQTVVFGGASPVLTVTSLINPVLYANHAYWVEMNAPLGSLIWNHNTTLASGIAETDGLGNWSTSNSTQGVVRITGTEATLAPEPQTWLMIAGGVAAVALSSRRRLKPSRE